MQTWHLYTYVYQWYCDCNLHVYQRPDWVLSACEKWTRVTTQSTTKNNNFLHKVIHILIHVFRYTVVLQRMTSYVRCLKHKTWPPKISNAAKIMLPCTSPHRWDNSVPWLVLCWKFGASWGIYWSSKVYILSEWISAFFDMSIDNFR